MALKNFSIIRRLLGENEPSDSEKHDLFREALLMTLARGTHADSYTDAAEVETVAKIIETHLGEVVPESDIRVAARSDLYESAPLDKWLKQCSRALDVSQRLAIVHALVDVIRVDGHVRSGEADFFNMVVDALDLKPVDVLNVTLDAT